MSGKLWDVLRGARRAEIFILIVIIALAGMYMLNENGNRHVGTNTELEARLRDILTYIDGVNAPEVMINQNLEGEITGVVIVARGVENIKTRMSVQNAVQILLDVEISRIEIIERK